MRLAPDRKETKTAPSVRRLLPARGGPGFGFRQQTELLKKLHEQTDQDVSVARFLLGRDELTREALSYCVWSPCVPALLPHADRVAFMEEEDDPPMFMEWDRVGQVLGHLMEPIGMYPERYRVDEFPSEAQLTALRGSS
jgi:hypothetical protein